MIDEQDQSNTEDTTDAYKPSYWASPTIRGRRPGKHNTKDFDYVRSIDAARTDHAETRSPALDVSSNAHRFQRLLGWGGYELHSAQTHHPFPLRCPAGYVVEDRVKRLESDAIHKKATWKPSHC